MNRVSNDDLMKVLMDIREGMGSMRAKLEDHTASFAQHLKDDARIAAAVDSLKLAGAQQAGAARVWTLVYTGIAGAIGGCVEYLVSLKH